MTERQARGLLIAAASLALGLSVVPRGWVESWWVPYWGLPLARGLGRAVSWSDGSVGEVLVLVTLLSLPLLVRRALRPRPQRPPPWAVGATGLLALVLSFQLVWGLHYRRIPASERHGWSVPSAEDPLPREEIRQLGERLIQETNRTYRELHQVDDLGVPTPRAPLALLEAGVEAGWSRAASDLGLDPRLAGPWPAGRALRSSGLFSLLGISGIYFPWTGEPHVNVWPPGFSTPHTLAHEKAHQRGFASEDEANFYGFWAATCSPDPAVRYSGWQHAQAQAVRALVPVEPRWADDLSRALLPGPARDRADLKAFWEAHRSPLTSLAEWSNEAYLRLNGVAGGRQSYGRSLRLLLGATRAGRWPCVRQASQVAPPPPRERG